MTLTGTDVDDYSFDGSLKSDRLRDLLRQSLGDGGLRPGDRLLSEPELAARYRVGRSTVREAITALVQEGRLYRIHGKGTFVAEEKPEKPIHRTLAVVMPYLFFSDVSPLSAGTDVLPRLMQALEGEARRAGANILLYLDNHLPDLERENIQNLLERQVDGVLLNYIGGDRNRDAVEAIRASGIPLVLIDRYLPDLPVDFVVTDNELGAYRATKLLIAQGFERVVYVTSPGENSSLVDRRAGYEKAMTEAGLPARMHTIAARRLDEHGMDTASGEERAYQLAQMLLEDGELLSLPCAILAGDAPIIAGFWQAVRERGLSSSQLSSLAFACFDEPFVSFPPSVFTVKIIQAFAEIGRRSISIIEERIAGRGPNESYRVFIEPEIYTSKV